MDISVHPTKDDVQTSEDKTDASQNATITLKHDLIGKTNVKNQRDEGKVGEGIHSYVNEIKTCIGKRQHQITRDRYHD